MEFHLDQGMAVLERSPATFASLLSGIGAEWFDATEGGETWSPYVIIGHLIHGERTDWIPRAGIIRRMVYSPMQNAGPTREHR